MASARPTIAPQPSAIRLRGVNKWFESFHVLCDIDLDVAPGECAIVWGPSGSGKSTLLRCVAGLEPFQVGTREIHGETVAPGPVRGVGMVFQSFNLFPHLRVIDNLTLGLTDVMRMPRRDARALALSHLERVRMAEYADRYPAQLSGGQQQRVAIARALCMSPRILLFDEPTSALDPELKKEVRDAIIGLTRLGLTMLVVTHEEELAGGLGGRMVFMNDGFIVGESTADRYFRKGAA
jgi:general L-amino acid transport system ATP-binding protein